MIISSTSDFSNFSRHKSKFYIFEDQTSGGNVQMTQITNQMFVNSDALLKNGFPTNHFTRIGETQEFTILKNMLKAGELAQWCTVSTYRGPSLGSHTHTGLIATVWNLRSRDSVPPSDLHGCTPTPGRHQHRRKHTHKKM